MGWDPAWEQIFKSQSWGKYPPVEVVRFVARNFYNAPDRRGVRLFEAGCGPGANLWFMAREGFSVYGMDGSEAAIGLARERLNKECPSWRGELKVGDIGRLPYPDSYFDAVIDVEAIYANSYENSRRIYSELARVTKDGGKLLSIAFAKGSWGDGTGENVGHNAWLASEGPLAGKGYSRFADLDEIGELISGFELSNLEVSVRTMNNRGHEIKEWVIEAVKENKQ